MSEAEWRALAETLGKMAFPPLGQAEFLDWDGLMTFTDNVTATDDDLSVAPDAALLLVDIQQGFNDAAWGRPSPDAAGALGRMHDLAKGWSTSGRPIVVVRHDSVSPGSPLRREAPGNALVEWVDALDAAVLVTKNVNSAFIGEPDLDAWLRRCGITQIVVTGIQTNMCVETTSRMGGNLGYDVIVPLDATSTFDLTGPDGDVMTAEELARATATNLHDGGFATVTTTAAVLAAAATVARAIEGADATRA